MEGHQCGPGVQPLHHQKNRQLAIAGDGVRRIPNTIARSRKRSTPHCWWPSFNEALRSARAEFFWLFDVRLGKCIANPGCEIAADASSAPKQCPDWVEHESGFFALLPESFVRRAANGFLSSILRTSETPALTRPHDFGNGEHADHNWA